MPGEATSIGVIPMLLSEAASDSDLSGYDDHADDVSMKKMEVRWNAYSRLLHGRIQSLDHPTPDNIAATILDTMLEDPTRFHLDVNLSDSDEASPA